MSESRETGTPSDTWRPTSPVRRRPAQATSRDTPTRLDVPVGPSTLTQSKLEKIHQAEQSGLSKRLATLHERTSHIKKERAQAIGQTASSTQSGSDLHSSLQQTPAGLLEHFETLRLDNPLNEPMTSKGITFYGKASTIEDVLTSVEIQQAAQGAHTDSAKSVVLAATFRGKALSWLTQQRKITPRIYDDYDEFVALFRQAFDLPEETKNALAAKQFRNLRQTKSVQDYAVKFQQLQAQLGIPEQTAIPQFVQGLKTHVRNVIVINETEETLTAAINEAIRVDARMYSERNRGSYASGSSFRRGKQSGIKCNTCGRFGHKAANCKIKTENY